MVVNPSAASQARSLLIRLRSRPHHQKMLLEEHRLQLHRPPKHQLRHQQPEMRQHLPRRPLLWANSRLRRRLHLRVLLRLRTHRPLKENSQLLRPRLLRVKQLPLHRRPLLSSLRNVLLNVTRRSDRANSFMIDTPSQQDLVYVSCLHICVANTSILHCVMSSGSNLIQPLCVIAPVTEASKSACASKNEIMCLFALDVFVDMKRCF